MKGGGTIHTQTLAHEAAVVALSKLKQKELTGHNDGPFVNMLQRWVAKGANWLDGQPWCACFATWCIYQAAEKLKIVPIIPPSASSSSLYKFASENNLLLKYPQPICIGLVKAQDPSEGKTHDHTFFVLRVSKKRPIVQSIDGNWKNAVLLTEHEIDSCDFMAIC